MNDVVLHERETCAPVAGHDVAIAFRSAAADERGQGLAEYGLILGLIAILCIVAVLFLSGNLSGLLSNVGNSI
jgi:pilus assembly protein Flp/PilA